MVTKCANPSCSSPFRYFRGGRLFLLEPTVPGQCHELDFREGPHRGEFFWLCEQCALTMTITFDPAGHPALRKYGRGATDSVPDAAEVPL